MLTRLCELETEIGKSLTLPHEVAHARVAWWQEECARLAAGAPRHPLTQALGAQLPAPLTQNITGLVGTAIWDLAHATFETRREVTAYCDRWAAAMIEPVACAAAPQAPEPRIASRTAARWRGLGAALREIELLAMVHSEARLGRLRLPLDELARVGAAPEALSATACPVALAELLSGRHQELRRSLQAAVQDLAPGEQPALRGLLVWVELAERLSRQAQNALPAWLPQQDAAGWTASWAAWRAARAAQRGVYRLQ